MRKYSYLLFTVLCLSAHALCAQKFYPITTNVPVITTFKSRNDSLGLEVQYDIWQTTFRRLISNINRGEIKVVDNNGRVITSQSIVSKLRAVDTITSINPITLEEEVKICKSMIDTSDLWYMLSALRIHQQWSITENGAITKQVIRYAPLYPTAPLSYQPVFWCLPDVNVGMQHSVIVSYAVYLKDIDSVKRKAFLSDLKDKLQNGKSKIYFDHNRMSPTAISKSLNKHGILDTITMIDPVSLVETVKISEATQQREIAKIYFTEEWTLDDRGNFSIRVIRYSPEEEIHWQQDKTPTWIPLFDVYCGPD